jgi:hypothetical protein
MAKVPGFELPLDEVRASLETLRRPLRIAILRFRNPFNVGAIIRVAHSFLVQEIVLVGDEPYYERAAMGMQRYENWSSFPTSRPWWHGHASASCRSSPSSVSTRAWTCGGRNCPRRA